MPARLRQSNHLMASNVDAEALARNTWLGMAHFAGTGPRGETCRTCAHWVKARAGARDHDPASRTLRPRLCARYQQLAKQVGDRVPHDAAACRHHERAASPPALSPRDGE